MNVIVFINQLGIGGTEKAACRWARALIERKHQVKVVTLNDGPRRAELERSNIEVRIVPRESSSMRRLLAELKPDVLHVHAPGHPHEGDVLGEALALLPRKIPVVQTNVFGQLANPKEDAWTDFRLFVSWTSCVQAARRCFKTLNEEFFRHASVAVYPVDADDGPPATQAANFRRQHGIAEDDILFGRLSRPEPNKWTNLPVDAFRIAARGNSHLKLLLREPPLGVAAAIRKSVDHDRFVILPATNDPSELALTAASLDAVLHTSSIGESFGYGIAEPMNYGKPVITNSTPWLDQAQVELVRHGECGFIASTRRKMGAAILNLAEDVDLRLKLGRNAKRHIRALADPVESTNRLENVLNAVVRGKENPQMAADILKAKEAARYLDQRQFGNSWLEQGLLRSTYYRARFHQWRATIMAGR